jgi:hypothetical protein
MLEWTDDIDFECLSKTYGVLSFHRSTQFRKLSLAVDNVSSWEREGKVDIKKRIWLFFSMFFLPRYRSESNESVIELRWRGEFGDFGVDSSFETWFHGVWGKRVSSLVSLMDFEGRQFHNLKILQNSKDSTDNHHFPMDSIKTLLKLVHLFLLLPMLSIAIHITISTSSMPSSRFQLQMKPTGGQKKRQTRKNFLTLSV